MSTLGPRDFDAILRDALRAEAASVEPQGRAFEQIAFRLRRPLPLPLAWLMHAWSYLALRVPEYLDSAVDIAAATLHHAAAVGRWSAAAWRTAERYLPGPENRHGKPSKLGWLRPVAMMTFAIFVITAGVYAAIDVSQGIAPSSGGPGSNHGQTGGSTGQTHPGQQSSGGHGGTGSSSLSTSKAGMRSQCTTSPGKATPSTSPQTSTSPSPSVSPSVSPSPSTSPSPSPSVSTSTSPATSPSPSVSPSAAGGTLGATSGLGRTADRSATARTNTEPRAGAATSGKSRCPKRKRSSGPSHPSALSDVHPPSVSAAALDELGLLPAATKARLS